MLSRVVLPLLLGWEGDPDQHVHKRASLITMMPSLINRWRKSPKLHFNSPLPQQALGCVQGQISLLLLGASLGRVLRVGHYGLLLWFHYRSGIETASREQSGCVKSLSGVKTEPGPCVQSALAGVKPKKAWAFSHLEPYLTPNCGEARCRHEYGNPQLFFEDVPIWPQGFVMLLPRPPPCRAPWLERGCPGLDLGAGNGFHCPAATWLALLGEQYGRIKNVFEKGTEMFLKREPLGRTRAWKQCSAQLFLFAEG